MSSDSKKSNFSKRNPEAETTKKVVEDTYPNSALDVALVDGVYKAVEVVYNLETGRARISNVKDATRLIGLSFQQQKVALRSLTKI